MSKELETVSFVRSVYNERTSFSTASLPCVSTSAAGGRLRMGVGVKRAQIWGQVQKNANKKAENTKGEIGIKRKEKRRKQRSMEETYK